MKMPDLESTVVAALMGAFLLVLIDYLMNSSDSPVQAAAVGALIGAGVQIGVRLTGVS